MLNIIEIYVSGPILESIVDCIYFIISTTLRVFFSYDVSTANARRMSAYR